MRWLRFFNPRHTLRLERDNAALLKQREGDRRGIKSLVDSVGRQATPGEVTALRCENVLLQGRVNALTIGMGLAAIELTRGRPSHAASVLAAMLDVPAEEKREAS
jgi:hypothetical protein